MPKFSKILISILLALSLSAGFSISHFSQAKEANNPRNESFERNGVYICPKASSLEEVNAFCPGLVILRLGETKDGMTLSSIVYEGKEYYLVSGFSNGGGREITPQALKQDAINKLEKIKIDNPRLKMFISQAICSIKRSLDKKYWQDEDNLKYERKLGKRMFIREARAAKYLEFALKKKKLTSEQENVIKEVLSNLVKADEILAKDSLSKAKKYQGINKEIDQYLEKVESNLNKAKEYVEKDKYQRAILKFVLAWQNSQKAIKLAEK
ncbi:MAG: hypothetical protein QME57_03875 [Patescibacteria group bacterium]|nr:hypothetical protein [Patescibacteria group bacterium]